MPVSQIELPPCSHCGRPLAEAARIYCDLSRQRYYCSTDCASKDGVSQIWTPEQIVEQSG